MAFQTLGNFYYAENREKSFLKLILFQSFSVFGNLFEEAAKKGLPGVQARHLGFFYEQAAQYASQRKKLAVDI